MVSALLKRLIRSGKSQYCSTASSSSTEEVKPAVKKIDTLVMVTRLQSHGVPFETAKTFASEINESLDYILDVSGSKSEMKKVQKFVMLCQKLDKLRIEAEHHHDQMISKHNIYVSILANKFAKEISRLKAECLESKFEVLRFAFGGFLLATTAAVVAYLL